MRTSSQFTKIGIPLIVVSFLVAVAIILTIVLSKKMEEPITKGKFISFLGTRFGLAGFLWVHRTHMPTLTGQKDADFPAFDSAAISWQKHVQQGPPNMLQSSAC